MSAADGETVRVLPRRENVRGYRPLPIRPASAKEYQPTEEENVAFLTDWWEEFVADRRRRGIPERGLQLPNGTAMLWRRA